MNIDLIKQKTGIVGESEEINEVLETVSQIAGVDISVLVNGESGTGKELIAKAIHSASKRSNNDLVIVNCGAIPEGIIESKNKDDNQKEEVSEQIEANADYETNSDIEAATDTK